MAVSPSVLGKVLEVFERNFRERGEIGASVSIWWDGVELISEGHGWCEKEMTRRWTERTLVPVYSATKVPAAATLLLALESRGLSAETPVREVWHGFPVCDAKFSHLLSHQCGLAALDHRADVFDHGEVVAAIEAQVPAWRLGEGHGYHPRTFGVLTSVNLSARDSRTMISISRFVGFRPFFTAYSSASFCTCRVRFEKRSRRCSTPRTENPFEFISYGS